jgi:hypothetical protein
MISINQIIKDGHQLIMHHTEIVQLLLAQPGIDFNKPNNKGWTPINNASY